MCKFRLAAGVLSTFAASAVLASCDDATGTEGTPRIDLIPRSVTPALVKRLPQGVAAIPLISSDDVLEGSPSFVFGGSADGAGLLENSDGTFTYLVNHEDNFAVSRITLDSSFKPVKGEYVITSDHGLYRLCSATLATPEEHGFLRPVFLTAGESSQESMTHALDPYGVRNNSRLLSAFGHWNAENAVPLHKDAYTDKTVVLIGDDDSGTYGGQLAMYIGARGDLDNGTLWVMARTDNNVRERDMVIGGSYPVEFRQIQNQKTLTGAQIEARNVQLNAISRSKYGRIYKLDLNTTDPTKGTLSLVLDGDNRAGPAGTFQNPDNILVTKNYAYIKEDPNGYGDETHDSYVYQYDLRTQAMNVVMELDHRRTASDAAKYNVGGNSTFGSWEYGSMIDVTDQLGGSDSDGTFLLAVQPHTWRGEKYRGVDGGTLRPNENQASQILVITGLPR